ncbi:MAG: aldehyde dehydrogenase family protein [Pseudomonadota bacterium]
MLNILRGRGSSVGAALISCSQGEAISVIGSRSTSMAAMRAASQKVRQVHLELGAKAPVNPSDDADPDAVAKTILYGSYYNAGLGCAQPGRDIVANGVYDKLVATIADQVGQFQLDIQKADRTEMGPLVSIPPMNAPVRPHTCDPMSS